MKKIQEFLWYCAGANVNLLRKCPATDQKKYALIGFSLLVVGLLAAIAFYFSFLLFIPTLSIAKILIAILWGIMIFVTARLNNVLGKTKPSNLLILRIVLSCFPLFIISITFLNFQSSYLLLLTISTIILVNVPSLTLQLSKKGFYEMTLEYEHQQLMIEHHQSIERFHKENPNTYYTPIEKVVAQNSDAYVEGIVSAFDLTGSSNSIRRYKSTENNSGEDKNNGYLKDAQARHQDYLNWAGDVRKSFETLKQEIESGEYSAI